MTVNALNASMHKTFNRTNYGKYSTREKIIKIWNEIPKTVKCSASLKIFKTKIKQFILCSSRKYPYPHHGGNFT